MSISAFVDPVDHERLLERARSAQRSLSAELCVAILEHLRRALKAREFAGDIEEER